MTFLTIVGALAGGSRSARPLGHRPDRDHRRAKRP